MLRVSRVFTPGILIAVGILSASLGVAAGRRHPPVLSSQETGFLNRTIRVDGVEHHFQIYLPEDFRRDDHRPWPIILFLHGRGERGSEGLWQTQIGLPLQVRDHPERWPFLIVMPQCTYPHFWTDPDMLKMAMAALDQETAEFHADPNRTYLSGISMGGYGAWELARDYPQRWAAITIMSGGPFWSYVPERWQQAATLPGEYARAVGHTSVWMFHGSEDNVVPERESELMYNAFRANGGRVRLWIYQGMRHDSWTRAYNEPELPRWLLQHHLPLAGDLQPFSERLVLPLHPAPMKLPALALDAIAGEYHDADGHFAASLFRQGDQLYEKDPHGEVTELEAESPTVFFYPFGSVWMRLTIERDADGRVAGLVYRDDRHEERWERKKTSVVKKEDARVHTPSVP